MQSSDAGSAAPSASGILEPLRIEAGQLVVRRMSALFAPCSDFASPSVWRGR